MDLTPISSPQKIRTIAVYDLEWRSDLSVRIVGVYAEGRYRHYRDIESFLSSELIPSQSHYWFYAHAGGLYDSLFVLNTIRKYGWAVTAVFSGSSAIIITVIKDGVKYTLLDSYWTIRASLRDIGEKLGGQQKGLEGLSESERVAFYDSAPYAELRDYNEVDCLLLWRALRALQQQLLGLGGQLNMTLASTAMELFRRSYLRHKIKTSEHVNSMARQAYFASRVEVFQKAGKNLQCFDINSSFPFSMTRPLPGSYTGTSRAWSLERLSLVDCSIEVPEGDYPPLPLRHKGKIYFPRGTWRGHYTAADLHLALEGGAKILRVHQVYNFAPFSEMGEYAHALYEMRRRTSGFEEYNLKILLNSLYGKTAEREDKDRVFIDPDARKLAELRQSATMLGPGIWRQSEHKRLAHVHVPIAAYITSYSRELLTRALWRYGAHYADTDSIYTENKVETGEELGDWKQEGPQIERALFVKPKLYKLWYKVPDKKGATEKVKAKGFRRLTPDEFDGLLEGIPKSTSNFGRFTELVRRTGAATPTLTPMEKRVNLSAQDAKRHFFEDGTSRAYSIDEVRRKK